MEGSDFYTNAGEQVVRRRDRGVHQTYFVESVGKRVVPTRSSAQGLPEIDDELVPPWSGFALGGRLQCPYQLYCRFDGQR
jgi:hypothetical protein